MWPSSIRKSHPTFPCTTSHRKLSKAGIISYLLFLFYWFSITKSRDKYNEIKRPWLKLLIFVLFCFSRCCKIYDSCELGSQKSTYRQWTNEYRNWFYKTQILLPEPNHSFFRCIFLYSMLLNDCDTISPKTISNSNLWYFLAILQWSTYYIRCFISVTIIKMISEAQQKSLLKRTFLILFEPILDELFLKLFSLSVQILLPLSFRSPVYNFSLTLLVVNVTFYFLLLL